MRWALNPQLLQKNRRRLKSKIMGIWQPGTTLKDVEKLVILEAYRFFEENKARTAQALDISVRNLDEKLKRYDEEKKNAESKDAATRLHVQSSFESWKKQPLPVREPDKIQEVPPRQVAKGNPDNGKNKRAEGSPSQGAA